MSVLFINLILRNVLVLVFLERPPKLITSVPHFVVDNAYSSYVEMDCVANSRGSEGGFLLSFNGGVDSIDKVEYIILSTGVRR